MELFGIIQLFLVFLKICVAQKLVTVEAMAKLPNPSFGHVAIYDAGESILIFGGYKSSGFVDAIFSYNTEQDTISLIANFPSGIRDGFATLDNRGNAYYIGGLIDRDYSNDIFKLDVVKQNLSLIGMLNGPLALGTALNSNTDENKTQIFSSYMYNEVTCLDLNTLIACGSKPLLGNYNILAAFEHNGYAYAFGNQGNYSIEKINLKTMESELLEGFGYQLEAPSVVSDGTFGYIIGGYFSLDAGIPVDGIIRYDPRTNKHTCLQVENFPVNGTDRLRSGAAVYVEKLDRIYMIGGIIDGRLQEKVWFIDLHPLREDQ